MKPEKRCAHIATLMLAMCACSTAWGIPAMPGKIVATQPDGTTVTVEQHGDENCNWMTTPDGYTLQRDKNGVIKFLESNPFTGTPQLSGTVYNGSTAEASAKGIRPGLKPLRNTADTEAAAYAPMYAPMTQIDGTFPAKGKRKLLMVLINYADTKPIYSQAAFNNYMNQAGYNGKGSFRDYYLENSYGALDITTTVTRWVTVDGMKSEYGPDGAIGLIAEALTALDAEIDFRDYDNDGDGILDGLAVIHQGPGQEASGGFYDIWSHSNTIYGMQFDGIQIRRYTIEPELLGNTNEMSTIGVMCHEFGHNLGAPDFYDTDYSQSGGEFPGTGVWDLMGSGAWNGDRGDRPAGTNMWQKIQLGWVTPGLLENTTTVDAMAASTFNSTAYRINTTVPNEYFILENRQQKGAFDSALPGHGMLIYHVDENRIDATIVNNTLNVNRNQAIYTVCGGCGIDPGEGPSTFGNVNSDMAPFPGAKNATGFSDTTHPSSKSNSGRFSYFGISAIKENADSTVSFLFTKGDTPTAPSNLSAVVNKGVVTIDWVLPASAGKVDHFNVMRNGITIAQTTDYSYTDSKPGSQRTLSYQVDAVYENGLISPYTEITLQIPVNHITDVTPVINGNNITLNWNTLDRLSRNTDDHMERYNTADFDVTTLQYAHRFRAADLQVYKGYKIRRVSFFPVQSPQIITCTLQVWESAPGSMTPTLISERQLKEFGSTAWNDILLTKTVEITGDKDIWIGVKITNPKGNIQVLSDLGPAIDKFGNLVQLSESGEWAASQSIPGNIFLKATLAKPASDPARDIVEPAGETDHTLDAFYPIGFAVYRDNQLIGKTAAHHFVDRTAGLVGKPCVYSVASIFKGGSESNGLEVEADATGLGLEDNPAAGFAVSVENGGMRISGYSGSITVSNIAGATVFSGYCNSGEFIALAAGTYIVKMNNTAVKIMVR